MDGLGHSGLTTVTWLPTSQCMYCCEGMKAGGGGGGCQGMMYFKYKQGWEVIFFLFKSAWGVGGAIYYCKVFGEGLIKL